MSWGQAVRACLVREENLQEGRQSAFRRWHFQQGPIDLIIGLEGESAVVDQAIERAWARFERVLEELVVELRFLKTPVPIAGKDLSGVSKDLTGKITGNEFPTKDLERNVRAPVRGAIARSMFQSCAPYGLMDASFVTPMAAVAGCVAQDILAYLREPGIEKSWVNNGGDIAWFAPQHSNQSFKVGIPGLSQSASLTLLPADQCWGIATSGWRGRSQSFGIADSVTVIAPTAGQADVAATLIANQVSLRHLVADHPQVVQRPANQIKDDSDLGDRLVTVGVGALSGTEITCALDSGASFAHLLLSRGWIQGAVLCLHGQYRVCGGFSPQVQGEIKDDRGEREIGSYGAKVEVNEGAELGRNYSKTRCER